MGRIVLRGFLHLLWFSLVVIACFTCARQISLLLDRVHLVKIDSHPLTSIGVETLSGGTLQIDNLSFSTTGPDDRPSSLRINLNTEGQLVVERAGRSITFGEKADSLGRVRVGAGESVRFQIERSLCSWPTPFDFNFMTGVSPSWKRHLYYRLDWQKPNGEKLQMTWRYEQWFYPGSGWAGGFMTRPGSTGLIRAELAP